MDRAALEQSLINIEPTAVRREKADRAAVEVPVEKLAAFLLKLRNDEKLAFDMLLAHTVIDWSGKEKLTTNEHELTPGKTNSEFELVYILYSAVHGHSVFVLCKILRENPVAPSAEAIWPIAHWQEREAYDLFGVLYDGHSDLRRIFLDDDWKGHPLRKDYKDDDMLEFEE